MQLTPLLISILLFVSGKLKPLEPGYQKLTTSLISIHQPINQLKKQVDQTKWFIASLPNLHYQNLKLKAENSQLKTQNLLLKNQLKLKNLKNQPQNAIPVRIIKVGQTIIATTNQADQVRPGMPLVYSTNLIGLVQKVSAPIVYITPLNNPQTSFPVQTDQNIKGKFVFQNQTPQMTNITSLNTPSPDNTIFTLPTEQIPEGLIVGQVKQTLTKPSDPIQRVEIKLLTNPTQLPFAHIITSP